MANGEDKDRVEEKPDFFERESVKLKDRDTQTFLIADSLPWGIHFTNDKGKKVGKLEFDKEGDLHFSGDADEAAKVFFTAVVQLNNKYVDETNQLAKLGLEVVEDFLPNVGTCVLQDYGRLNDFMMQAKAKFGG